MKTKTKDWIINMYGKEFFDKFLIFLSHKDNIEVDSNDYSDELIKEYIHNLL